MAKRMFTTIMALLLPMVTVMAERYMVIDLAGGSGASSYPVKYLNSEPNGGWTEGYKGDKLVLRRIEPGTFMMGSPVTELGRNDGETLHEVTLTQAFYIGVFEVTQKQWQNIMGTLPAHNRGDYRPVEGVTFPMLRGQIKGSGWPKDNLVDADSFMGVLRAKTGMVCDLPTDAQWEYACRAGTTTALHNGKDATSMGECPNMSEVGRYKHNQTDGKGGYEKHTIVGCYLPNAWGLYDMHGNVWEWCLDLTSPDLGVIAATDPAGPSVGTRGREDDQAAKLKRRMGADAADRRVVRGGCWSYGVNGCRSAFRSSSNPNGNHSTLGFRLVVFPEGTKPVDFADAGKSLDREAAISAYFLGENLYLASKPRLFSSVRDVSKRLREQVFERDGYQCVICKSGVRLELEHRRSLMNGGSNSPDNLYAVCRECHLVKTRMDSSLMRHRLKLDRESTKNGTPIPL